MSKKKKSKKDSEQNNLQDADVEVTEVISIAQLAAAQENQDNDVMASEEEITEEVTTTEEISLEVSSEGSSADGEVVADSEVPAVENLFVTDLNEIESAALALIFASPTALSTRKLRNLLTTGGYDVAQLDLVMESIVQGFENRGIQLVKSNGGYQLRTHPKHAEIVQKLVEEKPQRLSKSALEVLAIIAYKQPITRADVDHVRGTDSGHLLKNLLEKNLVRTEGHKESPGRPLLYGTTPYFLEIFSLNSLDDLPALEEFDRELKEGDDDAFVLDADPGFFDKLSGLDAEADRGSYENRAEDDRLLPDFGESERAKEELLVADEPVDAPNA